MPFSMLWTVSMKTKLCLKTLQNDASKTMELRAISTGTMVILFKYCYPLHLLAISCLGYNLSTVFISVSLPEKALISAKQSVEL